MRLFNFLFGLAGIAVAVAATTNTYDETNADDNSSAMGLRQRIKDGCPAFSHEAGDFDEARLIVIGQETKRENEVRACLAAVTADIGDHEVLVEGDGNGVVDCKQHNIPAQTGRTCKTFDTKEANAEMQAIMDETQFAKNLKDGTLNLADQKNAIQRAEDMKNEMMRVGRRTPAGQKISAELKVFINQQMAKFGDLMQQVPQDTIARTERAAMKKSQSLATALTNNHGVFTVAIVPQAVVSKNKPAAGAGAAAHVQSVLKQHEHKNPYAILSMQPK